MVKRPGEEKQRERVLSEDEIRLVWKALDGESPLIAALFRVRLLTAQRGGEVSRGSLVGVRAGYRVVDDSR